MVSFDLDKINSLLEELKNLPKIKEIRELTKRLTKEKKRLVPKAEPIKVPAEQRQLEANLRRSTLMKKKWNYIRQVWSNYPEIREKFGLKELFSQFHKRRKGKDVAVDDVFWQNPSP